MNRFHTQVDDWLTVHEVEESTRSRYSGVFAAAVRREWISTNPAEVAPKPRQPAPNPNPPTVEVSPRTSRATKMRCEHRVLDH